MKLKMIHLLVLAALLCGLSVSQPAKNVQAAENVRNLGDTPESLIRADGTLNLNTGFSGNLDVSNYDVLIDPKRGPLFSPSNGTPSNTWYGLGNGLGETINYIYAITVVGDDVYVGGQFGNAGGISEADGVAKWNGSSWEALGSGIQGLNAVFTIEAKGTDIYVGGVFSSAGGVAATKNIAKWNGTSWSSLGNTAFNGGVFDITISGSSIYAGGYFTDAGGNANADYVSKWNGSAWEALGTTPFNVPTTIFAVQVIGSNVYVGGSFYGAGGALDLNNIAKWNGSAWSALGPGLDNRVEAMAVIGTDLYVGGRFTNAGGYILGDYIAKWNGSAWSALGNPVGDYVTALAVSGNNLYVGGYFTNAASSNGDYIAWWDGANWHSFDVAPPIATSIPGGYSVVVEAIAAGGKTVYVGGNFINAGGVAEADRVAAFNLPSMPAVLSIARADTYPVYAATANYWVTFSESVSKVDAADFILSTAGISGASVASVSGSGSFYTVTVNSGNGDGTLRLDLKDNDTILGSSGNPLGGVGLVNGDFTSGEVYTVARLPTFADVPVSYWAYAWIERLYNAGITGGCSTVPLNYCPDSTVTRAQMAVFLLKSMHGKSYVPPVVGASTGFADVPVGYWADKWIKQLAAEGITGGCGVGIYCPDATVTRAQMAVFLLKAKHGSAYNPPAATGVFNDVPVGYWADKWIERLAAEGVTSGCGAGIYCPDSEVTRAQMAVFLVKAFSLP